jgi:hypothetical protein
VQRDDNCDKIAIDFDISIDDLKKFNDKKTWGWGGCGPALRFDTIICVSEGDPPHAGARAWRYLWAASR